jgi:hypothetical protein
MACYGQTFTLNLIATWLLSDRCSRQVQCAVVRELGVHVPGCTSFRVALFSLRGDTPGYRPASIFAFNRNVSPRFPHILLFSSPNLLSGLSLTNALPALVSQSALFPPWSRRISTRLATFLVTNSVQAQNINALCLSHSAGC